MIAQSVVSAAKEGFEEIVGLGSTFSTSSPIYEQAGCLASLVMAIVCMAISEKVGVVLSDQDLLSVGSIRDLTVEDLIRLTQRKVDEARRVHV